MRQEFSARTKLQAFNRALGVIDKKPHCEVLWRGQHGWERCGKLILGIPQYDHIQPDGLGGPPTLENCQVACGECHRLKTHEIDNPIMTKADRQRNSAAGIKRKSRPIRSRGFTKREIEADHDS